MIGGLCQCQGGEKATVAAPPAAVVAAAAATIVALRCCCGGGCFVTSILHMNVAKKVCRKKSPVESEEGPTMSELHKTFTKKAEVRKHAETKMKPKKEAELGNSWNFNTFRFLCHGHTQ